jgi:hypothetical protein
MILFLLISCFAQPSVPIEITVQTALVMQLPETPDPATTYIVTTADELDKKVYHVAKDILLTVDVTDVSIFSSIQEDKSLIVEIYKAEEQK